MDSVTDKTSKQLLYELLVYDEWKLEPDVVKCPQSSVSSPRKKWKYFFPYLCDKDWPPEDYFKILSLQLPWHVALNSDGSKVAILQDALLEVRSSKDEFTSAIGRATVRKDEFLQVRKLKWSPDDSRLSICFSDGEIAIYDCLGSQITTIPNPERSESGLSNVFVAGLDFLKSSNPNYSEYNVTAVYSSGYLRCYEFMPYGGCTELYAVNLVSSGISFATYSHQYNILFTASKPLGGGKLFENSSISGGISAWRPVNEDPYYLKIFPTEDEIKLLHSTSGLWQIFNRTNPVGTVVKMCVSHKNQYLMSLHSCGAIYVWLVPSLRMYRKWLPTDLDLGNGYTYNDCDDSWPIDIEWRIDEKMIVSRKDGSISVHEVETFQLCYGSGRELLNGHPRLSSAPRFSGFIALECETLPLTPDVGNETLDNSILNTSTELIQSTLFLITDMESFQPKKKSSRVVQHIYRMLGVRSTTPEELFYRKLDNNEYEEALELAVEFGIDTDNVFKKQWMNSFISKDSISNFLDKIRNREWALDQCVNRIPETIEGAKLLLDYGFKCTKLPGMCDGAEDVDFHKCSEKEKRVLSMRKLLLDYATKHDTYKIVLGGDSEAEDKYDMNEYDGFRKRNIVESAIKFAREENVAAVKILLKHHTAELLPFWLSILDNFPETLSPTTYADIFPACDDHGTPVGWADSAVNNNSANKGSHDSIQPKFDGDIGHLEPIYNYTSDVLTSWCIKRALSIEQTSRLVDCSLALINLAKERNIKGLDTLYCDFITLDSMVYDVGIDIDYLTLSNMSNSEKCMLIMEKVNVEEFVDRMNNFCIPFLDRNGITDPQERFRLILHILQSSSSDDIAYAIKFIKYLLEGNPMTVGGPIEVVTLLRECSYAYQRCDKLDETLDLIHETISWVSLLTNKSGKSRLIEVLHELRNEVVAAQILHRNRIPQTLESINSIKHDGNECHQIIQQMAKNLLGDYGRKVKDFETFLDDVLTLQDICFRNVSIESCFRIHASALLNSSSLTLIKHAAEVLCCRKEDEPSKNLSFDCSVKLVLEAANDYFNSASSETDHLIELSKACLFLIKEDNDDVQEVVDLISSLQYLKNNGLEMIPIQVRQTEDRIKLINLCLKRKKNLFKKPHYVYKLAAKLRVCGNDTRQRHIEVTIRLAEHAFRNKDYKLCADLCQDIISFGDARGWEICDKLANCQDFRDSKKKVDLFSFVIIHVPPKYLPSVVNNWKNVLNTLPTEEMSVAQPKSAQEDNFQPILAKLTNVPIPDWKAKVNYSFFNIL